MTWSLAAVFLSGMNNVASLKPSARGLVTSDLPDDQLWSKIEEFVAEEIKQLEGQADALLSRVHDLEDIQLDDTRLKRRLKTEASPLTVDRVKEVPVYPLDAGKALC